MGINWDDFEFFKGQDSIGYDITDHQDQSFTLDSLAAACISMPNCVAFNTLGFYKNYVNDKLATLPPDNKNRIKPKKHGIYIHKKRWNELKEKLAKYTDKDTHRDGYVYFPSKYIMQRQNTPDVEHKPDLSIIELQAHVDKNPELNSFDTTGYCTTRIANLSRNSNAAAAAKLFPWDGTYIKKRPFHFDPKTRIKCINLERRKDRKDYMIQQLTSMDILDKTDFYKAVDGSTLVATDDIKKLFANNKFKNNRAVIGCAFSHSNLWKELVNDHVYDNYCIFEDDIKFNGLFGPFMEQVFTMLTYPQYIDWDILYIGHSIKENTLNAYNTMFQHQTTISIISHMLNISIGGVFGYIISKRGATKLLAAVQKYGIMYAIDRLNYVYGKEFNIHQYETVPHIIVSEYVRANNKVDSDIQYDRTQLF